MSLIRSAYWLGKPKPGEYDRFCLAMDSDLIACLRSLPGVRSARVLWPQRLEDNPPDIFCQVLVEFDDRAGMERMLASPERSAMRERVLELAGRFEGRLAHIDFQVGNGKGE
ncbi:hypothetical protein WBP07_22545 (plasmid) [Novosphingobium sp. BL-8A]|uniref:hypothetical protein n=1 Tax=Novosphingobium sp. BL-8A TaxID=3127639 RepID=UPI0037563E2A